MNLLKQSEFDLLVKEANKRLPKKELNRIERTYSDLTEIGINEEKVAELFRFYKNSPETLAPKPRTIIQKIINFFKLKKMLKYFYFELNIQTIH